MKNKKLLSLKEAMKYLEDRGYDKGELVKYTPTELIVLATDQKARENE